MGLLNFNDRVDSKATEALAFYERHADSLDNVSYFENLTDIEDQKFDMDHLRAFCSVNSRNRVSYSHSRFMEYIAKWFGTTVKEMKSQWRNISK